MEPKRNPDAAAQWLKASAFMPESASRHAIVFDWSSLLRDLCCARPDLK